MGPNVIKEFLLEDGTKIIVYQGTFGNNPDLDIKVKYREPGKRERTPSHLHWAVDLMLKKEHNAELTKEFVRFLLEMWEKVSAFKTKEEQQVCQLKYSGRDQIFQYFPLNSYGDYSVEFIAKIMELLMIQEKTGLATAFMFKGVLESIYTDKDIFSIISSARFNGR